MSYSIIGTWIPITVFLITSYLNFHFNEHLFTLSEKLIIEAQKYESPLLNYFFIFFTFLI